MVDPKLSAPPPVWHDKIKMLMPASIKKHWASLTVQQRRTYSIITSGLAAFLLVWIVAAALHTQPSEIVSSAQLQIPTKDQGTHTAVTKPIKNFPEDAAQSQTRMTTVRALNLTPLQKDQLLELRQNVDNIYRSVLSFPLDEAKMIVFAQAATKIDMINAKWDTLIAGAANDALATEYLTSATLENKNIFSQVIGITADEYNEIYNLSARDADFNKIANAYKQLVADGIWGPVTPVLPNDRVKPVNPALRFPVLQSSPTIPKLATPAAGDTALKPLDSPGPPYSAVPGR